MDNKVIKRGQIWKVELDSGIGSEQSGDRFCVILQNNIGNKYSPTTIVALCTSKDSKHNIPTHMKVKLHIESTILLEQILTIDKSRLSYCIGEVYPNRLKELNSKLKISLGL